MSFGLRYKIYMDDIYNSEKKSRRIRISGSLSCRFFWSMRSRVQKRENLTRVNLRTILNCNLKCLNELFFKHIYLLFY